MTVGRKKKSKRGSSNQVIPILFTYQINELVNFIQTKSLYVNMDYTCLQ